MVTIRWCVAYKKDGVIKEEDVTLTGSSFAEISPVYMEKLNSFGPILKSVLVEYKEDPAPQRFTVKVAA